MSMRSGRGFDNVLWSSRPGGVSSCSSLAKSILRKWLLHSRGRGTKVGVVCGCVFVLTPPLPAVVGLLHGDMTQGDRDTVITAFKKREFPTLVATDVAGQLTVT